MVDVRRSEPGIHGGEAVLEVARGDAEAAAEAAVDGRKE
jgi:hypothetical protein